MALYGSFLLVEALLTNPSLTLVFDMSMLLIFFQFKRKNIRSHNFSHVLVLKEIVNRFSISEPEEKKTLFFYFLDDSNSLRMRCRLIQTKFETHL